jgi:hypothetical protein
VVADDRDRDRPLRLRQRGINENEFGAYRIHFRAGRLRDRRR